VTSNKINPPIKPDDIDALLPQTQCGLCGYAGCRPYAEALAKNNAEINLCLPGGTETLINLGNLLSKDPTIFLEDMTLTTKKPGRAIIREAECIGCTKCIQACPVEAIVGSAKNMHTVLMRECTGCELCIPPCPVDCIDMEIVDHLPADANHFRKRYEARNERLQSHEHAAHSKPPVGDKKNYLLSALARYNTKKNK